MGRRAGDPPALATLAGTLIWVGEFDQGDHWPARAGRTTQAEGEPGIRLLVHLISAILPAARGHHRQALAEFLAAAQVRMIGEHAFAAQVTAWTIASQARVGMVDQARTALATSMTITPRPARSATPRR